MQKPLISGNIVKIVCAHPFVGKGITGSREWWWMEVKLEGGTCVGILDHVAIRCDG